MTIFALAPLTYPGFIQSHAGLLPVYNLHEFGQHASLFWSAAVGQSWDPVRNGGPLPYAVADVARWLGASAPQAVLLSFGAAFLVGAWAVYRWVRRWAGASGALLAAVLYTYLPYHLAAVYVRGDLAESWTMGLLPLAFWSVDVTLRRRTWGPAALLLSWLLLAAAHPGVAVLSLPFLAAYGVAMAQPGMLVGAVWIGAAVIATAGASFAATAWSPNPISFAGRFPMLFELVSPTWRAAGQPGDWLNPAPLQIGLAAIGLALLSAALLATTRRGIADAVRPARRAAWLGLGAAGLCLLLVLAPSVTIWELLGWQRLVSFPWQILGLAGLGLALAAGSAPALDARLRRVAVQAALVALTVLASHGYLSPRFFDFEIDFTPTEKVPHRYVMTPGEAPAAVFGEHQLALLDVRLEGPLRHGATVRLNALWQVLRATHDDYAVFVHVLDEDGKIWGQRNVKHATSEWGLGEIVPERYEFQIQPDGPRDGYRLEVGLYLPETGERMRTGDASAGVTIYAE